MKKLLATGIVLASVGGGSALAQAPAVYTWTGYGVNVPGSSKCPTYKMNIEVTVTGTAVKGIFQQEGGISAISRPRSTRAARSRPRQSSVAAT